MLHTMESLVALVSCSGFKIVEQSYIQRYGLANHLHWLNLGLPGGQDKYSEVFTPALEVEYEKMLASKKMTYTILLVAKK